MAFETVLEHQYFLVKFDKETKAMYETYLPGNSLISEEEMKEYSLGLRDLMKELGVKRYVTDQLRSEYVFAPKFQQWVIDNFVTALIEMGVERTGMVVSQEFITALSNEQLMDDGNAIQQGQIETKLFTDSEEALAWLTDDSK